MVKNIIIMLIISGVLLPSFSFAQGEGIKFPENWEEIKAIGQKFWDAIIKDLPGIIVKIWQEEVLPIWQKMGDWFKMNIWPEIDNWFQGGIALEIEKRKALFEEEFRKEKEEMKEDILRLSKFIWINIKELIWEKIKELIK